MTKAKPTLQELKEGLLAGRILMRIADPDPMAENDFIYDDSERFHSGGNNDVIRISMRSDGRFRVNGRSEPEFPNAATLFFIDRGDWESGEDDTYSLLDSSGQKFMEGYESCYFLLSDDPQDNYAHEFMLVAMEALGITDPSDYLMESNLKQMLSDLWDQDDFSFWEDELKYYRGKRIPGRGSHQGLQESDLTPQGLANTIKAGLESGLITLHLDHDYMDQVDNARDREQDVFNSTPEGSIAFATHIFWVGTTGEVRVTGDSDSLSGFAPVLRAHIILNEDGDYLESVYTDGDSNPLPEDLTDKMYNIWMMITDDIQPESFAELTNAILHVLGVTPDLNLLKTNAVRLGEMFSAPEHIEEECDFS